MNKETKINEFGKKITTLRKNKKMNQTDLANKIGISRSALGSYENNERKPDIETIFKLADFFEVTSDYLIGRSSNPAADIKTDAICEYTGLNPKAISLLHSCSSSKNINSVINFILSEKYKSLLIKFCQEMENYKNFCELSNEHRIKYSNALNSDQPGQDKVVAEEIKQRHYFEDQKTISSKKITRHIQQVMLDYSKNKHNAKPKNPDKADDVIELLNIKKKHFSQLPKEERSIEKFNNEMFKNMILACGGTIVEVNHAEPYILFINFAKDYFKINPQEFNECVDEFNKLF